MDKDYLVLKRASTSRSSGEWSDDDYDVLAGGVVIGRILKSAAAPVGTPWLWTLAYGHHEDRTPIYGYEATREAAMAAFAKRAGGGNRPALPLARPRASFQTSDYRIRPGNVICVPGPSLDVFERVPGCQ